MRSIAPSTGATLPRCAPPWRRPPAFPATRWSRSTSSPTSDRGGRMGLFGKWSRRDLLKNSGMAAGALTPVAAVAAPETLRYTGTAKDNLFTRIGVRPLINGRGTYTIISGSRSLPEVKQAMFEASHYYVQMDEMMEGIGAQLAKLTGAE